MTLKEFKVSLPIVAMEGLCDIAACQEVNKGSYIDKVLEATINPTVSNHGVLVQKLYTDIIQKSSVDFGKIPESKGDLQSYKEIDVIDSCIETLGKLFTNRTVPEFETLKKLYDNVTRYRSDFEFGFKFNIDIIQIIYNTSVYTIHELINFCTIAYVNFLKESSAVEISFGKIKKKDLIILKNANGLVKSFESGEWATLMKSFKGNSNNFLGYLANAAGTTVVDALSKVSNNPIVRIVGAVIVVFVTIRALISTFYKASGKLDRCLQLNKDFLKVSMEVEEDKSSKSFGKQKAAYTAFDKITNAIETRIFKMQVEGQKEIEKSNREDFSEKEVIKEINSFGDFQLI